MLHRFSLAHTLLSVTVCGNPPLRFMVANREAACSLIACTYPHANDSLTVHGPFFSSVLRGTAKPVASLIAPGWGHEFYLRVPGHKMPTTSTKKQG